MTSEGSNLFASLIGSRDAEVAILSPGDEPVTYADLAELSGRYAGTLAAAGIEPGDRLIAVVSKSMRSIALYLAVLRLGAVYVPLNPSFTRTELDYFVDDARPRVVVCDPDREEELGHVCAAGGARVLTLDATASGSLDILAEDQAVGHAAVPRQSDDLAAILYTSGTTGRSKGAMLTHGNLLANARALQAAWDFTRRDVLVHALPVFHTHGLFVGINVTFLSGGRVILLPRFDADAVAQQLPNGTVLMGVPTYYTRLLDDPRLPDLCGSIRLFVSGSAPLAPETHAQWRERTGHAILERYGMTETTMLTSNPLNGERRPGTVGRALDGVSVRVARPDADGIGMIQVAGPNVFRGYWGMPEKTAEEFTDDGYFITGDLGRFDADGYLHIVGRAKDLVISGGYNIYPKEIEVAIDDLDGVLESAVFGVPDADVGERVVAAIVAGPSGVVTREAIEDHVAGRLAPYKRPRTYVFLPELPRNVMGKVQKNVLRSGFEARERIA